MARKSHQDSAARLVTAKRGPERAIKTRQYDLLRPRVGQKKPPRLGSTICYGQTWARKSHQDSAVRFVTAKSWPERATKTRQYDLLRLNVGQKEPPRLGSTNCYGQELARKSHQDSAVRFITAKTWPERATKTRQYDLLRPNVGQKEPPRLGSTICYGQTWARKSRQDSAIRFVTAKSWPERATETRQYDLLLPNVGQIVTAKSWPEKSHQDSAVRFVTAKSWPEKATKTREYDLLRPNVGQKEPPRLGSTICYCQELARKSHQDSAVRFVKAKSWPEKASKTRQHDLLRPNVGQKEPSRLGSTICYGQDLARKSHQDSAVRFVTAKRGPERATKTRQYELSRLNVGQKEPPRLGCTMCCGQTWARKSHRRFVTAKSCPERTTKTRQCDLLRPRAGQKEPPRLGSTICYGQELARKSHRDSAVRFVAAKNLAIKRATKTRQYDLLRPRLGQKEPPRLGSTICYGQTWARKSHQDSAVRVVTAKSWPERATKTRQSYLLRRRVNQKEPPRPASTIRYGQKWARKNHQDSAVRLVTAKRGPRVGQNDVTAKSGLERGIKIRQYDMLRPRVGQKEPTRLGSTICYGQDLARKSHQDSAVRFVTAKRGPERATKTRQYDLLRPRVVQKEPPRLGSTICYGQELARKGHQGSAVRFVMAKRGPERATKTRQYDLLRPRVGQKSHRDSAVRFVTAKRGPERTTKTRRYDLVRPTERATETRQYDLLRPNVGQKEPPRLGSTMCYGQELARKSHQDSAVRFVTAKSWPEKATETRQYDLLRPRIWP